MEGEINKNTINDGLVRGRRAAGDLIPWTIAQQYQDQDFPALAGARIVRIATHPEYQNVNLNVIIRINKNNFYLIKYLYYRWDMVVEHWNY